MVDSLSQRGRAGLWGLRRHSVCEPEFDKFSADLYLTTIVRQPPAEGKALPGDSCTESHMPFADARGESVRARRPSARSRQAPTTASGTPALRLRARRTRVRQNARMFQVRHRSYATYSRQPRQVRKEATVTGSCVCSEPPVPGLFSGLSRCGLDILLPILQNTEFPTWT